MMTYQGQLLLVNAMVLGPFQSSLSVIQLGRKTEARARGQIKGQMMGQNLEHDDAN